MTTVFEVRFTNPTEFLDELAADYKKDAIAGDIVRLALRKGPATLRMLNPDAVGGDRVVETWAARFVEASYISTRQQLVKLSTFCGTTWAGNGNAPFESEQTDRALQQTMRKVQSAVARLDRLEVRGGGLFIEDGAWLASPQEGIDAPPAVVCATCHAPIYYANDAWRHRAVFGLMIRKGEVELTADDGADLVGVRLKEGQTEARVETLCPTCIGEKVLYEPGGRRSSPCPDCRTSPGVRVTLHHLADPEVENRTV